MKRLTLAATAMAFFASTTIGYADDHLFTAVGAGGLTTSSQPFLNGTNNPGRPGVDVAGQGSPLSGADHTTPATEQQNSGQVNTPPPVGTKTAPSGHSSIP
jgi:hypothetical protein